MKRILLALWLTLLPALALAQETPAPPAQPGAEATQDIAGAAAEISAEVEDDRGFLTRFLERNLSSAGRSVVIEGFQGALSSRATFTRLAISDPEGTWLEIRNGAIQWNRSALFGRRIEIQELSAEEILLPRLPAGESRTATPEISDFQLPTLPVAVNIANIAAARVQIGEPVIGEAAVVSVNGSMQLGGGEGQSKLAIERVDGKRGTFALDAAFSNETRNLKLDLTLDEAEGGLFANLVKLHDRPAVQAEIHGEGPLSDFAADIRLATAGQPRVTGRVSATAAQGPDGTPGTGFRLELTGDVASLLPPENRPFFGAQSQLLAEGWRGQNGRISLPVLLVRTEALSLTGSLTTNETGAPQSVVLLLSLGEDAGATQLPVRLPIGGAATTVQSGNLQISYDAATGDAWTAAGRLGDLVWNGNRLGEVTLDGNGTVPTADGKVQQVLGDLSLAAAGVALQDAGLRDAIGSEVTLRTGFNLTPGNALRLTGLSLDGQDYGLSGTLDVNGLSTGITVTGDVDAAYEDLSRLSTLAGRDLTGRADAKLTGLYTVLTRGFDIDARIEGNDLSVEQEQLDRLLGGASVIEVSASRGPEGIEIRNLAVNAQRLTATAQGTLSSEASDLRANLNLASLTDADPELAGSLSAEAVVSGGQGMRRLALNGEATDLILGIAELDRTLAGRTNFNLIAQEADGSFRVEQLRLANPQLTVDGQGNFVPGQLDARFDLSVPDLAVLGRGLSGALRAQATASESGGTQQFSVTGTGTELRLGQEDVDGALTGTTRFDLQATRRDGVVTIQSLDIANQQLNASATGTIGANATDIDGSIDIRSLASFGRGWRGALSLEGSLSDDGTGVRRFDVTGTGQDLALGASQVDGALTGTTTLALRGTQSGSSFTIEQGELVNAQTTIRAEGTFAPQGTDLTADIDFGNLASLGLGWSGSLNADASLVDDGTGARRLTVDGVASNLSLGQAEVDAALAGETRLTVNALERGGVFTIENATIANPRLSADARGTVGGGNTDLTVNLDADDLRFLGRGIGGGVAATAQLTDDGSGTRRISAQGTATGLSIGNAQVDPLLAGQTTFDLAATQSPAGIAIERLVARNGQLQVTTSGNPRDGLDVDASLSNLALLVPGIPGPATATGTVRQEPGGIILDVAATAPGGTRAQIAGRVATDGGDSDLRISGVSDAAIANPFLRVRSVEGPVSFDLRLAGPPALESLTGTVNLNGARLSDPNLGLSIDPLQATANLQNGLVNLDVRGTAGAGGTLRVTGPVDLRGGSPELNLQAELNSVVLRNPDLYQTTADGTVSITGRAAEGPLISGRILLEQTEFRIPTSGLGGARAIPDITHLGEPPAVRATRARAGLLPFPSADSRLAGLAGPPATPPAVAARLDLVIDAPNQVFVRGRGIDAELGGQIRLTGTARNIIPIGQLELIRGRVDLLGRRFTMTEGLIELQGSLVPVIRLVAETQRDNITTRIIIDGEIRDPDITFESNPQLPEEEVLSQLLFGRGLDSISALQAAQLANAIAVLAGRGSEGIVSNLRDSVGLDDLDLTTDEEGDISVRAGKYLSDNLYTDVQVEADGTSKINLNLDVSQELTARGSVGSDGDSTVGLFYERDY
ncbi:translocation/assembly module TamB domain-containing protein [Paracoccus aeridis]|uniref:translocation/assembly module TamB domain-containing protein n=1 Tax=Paracoccus aeridis TaxID=1966466 RepID=UPI0010AB0841|nr:translocation/assembly module TamB domain-containing protein [Paracoccus aeridis]